MNEAPKLPVAQAIAAPPDTVLPDVSLDRIGNPFGADGPLSSGRGGPLGIGDGGCCGVGNDKGPGIGGTTAQGRFNGRPTERPTLLYKVEPEYSEEARKARVQGVVVLSATVDVDGRLRDIRVVNSLGLGLDEAAIDAAKRWRFKPATLHGEPVPHTIQIEVAFHLL